MKVIYDREIGHYGFEADNVFFNQHTRNGFRGGVRWKVMSEEFDITELPGIIENTKSRKPLPTNIKNYLDKLSSVENLSEIDTQELLHMFLEYNNYVIQNFTNEDDLEENGGQVDNSFIVAAAFAG